MPELPEVETTCRGIEPWLDGQSIRALAIRNGALRWPVSEELYGLQDQRVVQVLRRGKYILLELETGTIIIHLGMSGSLRVVDASAEIKKHDHIDIVVSNGKRLRFNDPRRFGCMLWTENWAQHALIRSLGPEPLGAEFEVDYFYQSLQKRSSPIKLAIMDSHLVVGVGNIYANEALFISGIDPRRAANRISRQRITVLRDAIVEVLGAAIRQGGTTLRDFVNSDGKPGYFSQQLRVYGKAGTPCLVCATELKEVRQSARSTVFCPQCQK